MRKVDTAWLRMDSPSNLMMINGVWCVSPGISLQALRERASERLLQYPRFRQCAVEDATGASWVDDAQFDITAHVVPTTLALRTGQSPQAALQERDQLQAVAAGVAGFRAQFERQKLAELGKQQAREAFERQKAEQERQKQAEQARQQAQADRLKELADQRERQRQEREAKKQERDGPGWSR